MLELFEVKQQIERLLQTEVWLSQDLADFKQRNVSLQSEVTSLREELALLQKGHSSEGRDGGLPTAIQDQYPTAKGQKNYEHKNNTDSDSDKSVNWDSRAAGAGAGTEGEKEGNIEVEKQAAMRELDSKKEMLMKSLLDVTIELEEAKEEIKTMQAELSGLESENEDLRFC